MNIFICLKQVPDTETNIVLSEDKNSIKQENIKWIMNPYDEFATEQAVQIKERLGGKPTVIAIRVGENNAQAEVLRTALAMGADEAILVECKDYRVMDPFAVAMALFKGIENSGKRPDLILAGKQSVDGDNFQVPQILAGLLNIPVVTGIIAYKSVSVNSGGDGDEQIEISREIDGGGTEVLLANMPIVLSCNKGLNTPRYPSLPGIMKAKKKPFNKYPIEELKLHEGDAIKSYFEKFKLPPERPQGKKFVLEVGNQNHVRSKVKEVIELLRSEAKVI